VANGNLGWQRRSGEEAGGQSQETQRPNLDPCELSWKGGVDG